MRSSGRVMSHRELSLTMKTIGSRKVRESSKVASAIVAARLGGKRHDERSNRVSRVHAEDKMRVAQLRAAKPGVVYGDAVKEANLHGCVRGSKRISGKEGLEPWRAKGSAGSSNGLHNTEALKYVQEDGGWKMLSDAQAVEAKLEDEARREASRRSKKVNAAFLSSQEQNRKQREVEEARENVTEGRRLAEEAAEYERCQKREAWRARKAGRELRDLRQAQVTSKEEARLVARTSAIQEELLEVEKNKALDRAEAWVKEQARRDAREKNRLNKEENKRLILLKIAEHQENIREEQRIHAEYSAKMDAEEAEKRAATQRVLDRQAKINERMSKIYDRFKAQEDSVEKRVDEEQRIEMETDARRSQEKEIKRVQLLKEQTRFLQNQERLLHRRLAEERREDLAEAAEIKRLNRQARQEEAKAQIKRREENVRIQSLLKLQIADKAKGQHVSGGLTTEERLLNRSLLGAAAETLGLMK